MHACLDLLLKILWIFGNTKRHKNTLPLSWLFELDHRVIAELISNTINKMAESFGFTDNPRYIAEKKNYMEALLKRKHLPIPYAKSFTCADTHKHLPHARHRIRFCSARQ